jgi:hypothetical protein
MRSDVVAVLKFWKCQPRMGWPDISKQPEIGRVKLSLSFPLS